MTPLQLTRATSDGDALVAHVQYIDRFGNVQLDAEPSQLQQLRSTAAAVGLVRRLGPPPLALRRGVTFADVEAGELVFYEDAHRRPAIAVNRGSAAERLGVGVGDELRIAPARRR